MKPRIIVLKAKANLAAVFGNRTAVKRLLMQTAEQSQRELIPQLEAWKQQGEVRRYRRFWIINAIAVEGTQQVFQALERHPARRRYSPHKIHPRTKTDSISAHCPSASLHLGLAENPSA
jgi:hypothetical protein